MKSHKRLSARLRCWAFTMKSSKARRKPYPNVSRQAAFSLACCSTYLGLLLAEKQQDVAQHLLVKRRFGTRFELGKLESSKPLANETFGDLRLNLLLVGLVVLAVEEEIFDVGKSLARETFLLRQVADDGLDQFVPPLYYMLG